MRISKILLMFLVAILALYSLLTNDFRLQKIMLLSMVAMFILIGMEEFKKDKKATGYANIAVSNVIFIFLLFSL